MSDEDVRRAAAARARAILAAAAEQTAEELTAVVMRRVFETMQLNQLGAARLVCRQWNEVAVEQKIRSMEAVSIRFGPAAQRQLQGCDYYVSEAEELKTILTRHAQVKHLKLTRVRLMNAGEQFSFPRAEIGQLADLETLKVTKFSLQPCDVDVLGLLPKLRALELFRCRLTGENLHKLADSIRELRLFHCIDLHKENILMALQVYHARDIPLEVLLVRLKNLPAFYANWMAGNECESLPLLTYVLESFASLKVLVLQYSSHELGHLRRMVATNLETLVLEDIEPQIYDYNEAFFPKLFERPLPRLRRLTYELRPLKLDNMVACLRRCPNLVHLVLYHECKSSEYILDLLGLKQLEYLELEATAAATFAATDIVLLVASCTKLSHLRAENLLEPLLVVDILKDYMRYCPNRAKLSVQLNHPNPDWQDNEVPNLSICAC